MTKQEIDFWKQEIEIGKQSMSTRHQQWKDLLSAYHMNFKIPGLGKTKTVRLSRMYPLVRQIIAGVGFRFPKIHVNAKMGVENEQVDLSEVSLRLERAGNEQMRLMKLKPEVHQTLFDLLFCSVGWMKCAFNPNGTPDGVVVTPTMPKDMMIATRRSPFRVYVDPMGAPQRLSYHRYIFEVITVPVQFVMNNPRFNENKRKINLNNQEETPDDMLLTMGGPVPQTQEDVIRRSHENGKFVDLVEIHDLYNFKRDTFAPGVDEPIEEIDHPYRKIVPIQGMDPLTGEGRIVGFQPEDDYIFEEGYQYIPIKFDMDMGFYPNPPLDYVADLEKLVVDSVSRRSDLLKKFQRILFANQEEKNFNAKLGDDLSAAGDADVVFVKNLDNIKPADWSGVPQEQISLERDAVAYEEQSLHVADLAESAQAPRVSATAAALGAGQASLNREWMQGALSDMFTTITGNGFRLYRDPRYIPEGFVVNLGPNEQEVNMHLLTSEDFNYEFMIDIDASSMRPMIEEIDRTDAITLFDRMVGSPNVDRLALDRMLLETFQKRGGDKLLNNPDADSIRLAEMENTAFLVRGQDPGVVPGMDHGVHIRTHGPTQIQALAEFQTLTPEQQEQVMQVVFQHATQHMEMLTQGGQMGQATGFASQPNVAGQQQAGNVQSITQNVQSNAQSFSNDITQAALTSGIGT